MTALHLGRSSAVTTVPELAARIASFPIVSCDIFDTALLRRLARPEDALLAVGARARARGLVACSPEAFREYRLEAERATRAAAEASGYDEVTIAEVYAHLAACGLVNSTSGATMLAALEFETERSLCEAAEPLRRLLAARNQAQRLVFVSDTMLPGDWLDSLLRGCGYGGEFTVFSSADARRSKHTGRLFAHVLEALGCTAADVVHVGDNPASDVARAQERGIAAVLLPQPGRLPEPERLARAHPVLRLVHSHRRSAAVAAAPLADAPGLYRYLTTLLIGFTLFVFAEARRRGIRRLYFLSRDGYLPFAVAQRLASRSFAGFELRYLHVSRRSIAVPTQSAEDLPRLAEEIGESTHGQPLSTAFEFLGVDAATTAGLLRDLGIDPDRRVGFDAGLDELRRLFDACRGLVMERLQARRAAALIYLEQAGFLVPGPRLIVDIGWRGTTQEALNQLTGLPEADIAGCYLGLWSQALRPALNLRNATGYLFSFGHPRAPMDTVLDGYILFEMFFSAPQATVLHYEIDSAGQAVPIHATEQEPGASVRRQAIEAIEVGCLAEFDALDAILDGAWPEAIDPDSALLDIEQLLTRPTAEQVAEINRIPFVQGINGVQNTVAVSPVRRHEWLRPEATLRRIRRAAWRGGAARTSLPWPIPSMTFRDLEYRVRRLRRLLSLR